MGRPKSGLKWRQTTLLDHVVNQLAPLCDPIVLATSTEVALPELSRPVIVQSDEASYQGPLSGLITGFQGVPATCDSAVVVACDLPFLSTAVVERLVSLWAQTPTDALICSEGDRWHPLLGVYRRTVVTCANDLLRQGQRRMLDLFPRITTAMVTPEQLRDLDPGLLCLRNINSPADYEAALERQSELP